MKYRLVLLLFLFVFPCFSQSVKLFDIDDKSFPNVKGKFYSYDVNGNQLKHDKSKLSITENGVQRTIVNVSCPSPPPPKSLSAVLVMDVSLSMVQRVGSATNLELAQAAATSWVNALPGANNECAITSFSEYNYVNQDFTNDKTKLLTAINQLRPVGGTDYDMALLNPMGGGLKVAKYAKYQKVIVFLTDGEPNRVPKVNEIISEAQFQGCIIYCVTLGIKAPAILHEIADKTGGAVFENVTTIQQAESVYQRILQLSRGVSPCTIEWLSAQQCDPDSISVLLSVVSNKASGSNSYVNSKGVTEEIEIIPSTVKFTSSEIGKPVEQTVIVKSLKGNTTISDIRSSNSRYSITPKNFSLKQGDSIQLTVSYTATEDSYTFSEFSLIGNICSKTIFANGLLKPGRPTKQSLRLTHPNGGETFLVGSDTVITWTGISPDDKVRLEYSVDSGKNWIYIDTARGLKYNWNRINKPTSDRCLVKISQLNSDQGSESFEIAFDGVKAPRLNSTSDIHYVFNKENDQVFIIHNDYLNNNHIFLRWSLKENQLIDQKSFVGTVGKVSISPNDRYFALHLGGSVRVYDSDKDVFLNTITTKDSSEYYLDFNSKSNLIALIGKGVNYYTDSTMIRTYFISESGTITPYLELKTEPYNYWIRGIVFSPIDSNVLIIPQSTSIHLWNLNTSKKFCNYEPSSKTHYYKLDQLELTQGNLYFDDRGYYVGNYRFSHPDSVSPNYSIRIYDLKNCKEISSSLESISNNRMAISENGKLIVSWDSYSYKKPIRVWDLKTGTELLSITNQTTGNNDIKFTKDNRYISIMMSNNIHWKLKFYGLGGIGLQEDISDATFSIAAPSASALNINMGDVLVTKYRDSVVTGYIRNTGTWKVRVDSLYFRGRDASAFKLISGFPKYDISIGGNKAAEFCFTPLRVGPHSAEIVIITQSDTLVYDIIGNGVQQSISIGSTLIDFGQVELKRNKDSLNVSTVKNIGSIAITIDSTKHSFPNDIDFSTLSGGGAFTLAPGEERKLNLRFTPSSLGRTSGTLEFYFKGPGSPATVQLFGEGIKKSPSILTSIKNIKTLLCEQLDTVDVTITNDGAATLDISNISVSGSNSSEFRYIGNRTVSILPDSNYQAKVIFTPLSKGDKTAELVIFSNADQDSIFSLQLNGRKNESILSVSSEVNIGTLCPNEEKGFDVNIQNTGNILAPISILADSTIETTSLKDSLFIGQQKNLSFTFKGLQNAGPFTRQIKVSDTCGNIYPVTVKGTIISPIIEIEDLSITSIIGSSKEGIMKIKNLSNVDVSVNSISGVSNPFSLQSSTIPFILPGNAVREIKISYLPQDTVQTTQTIFVTGDPCLLKDTVLITGIPASSRAVVMVGNYIGYPGDIIDIPIELTDSQNINQSGLTSMSIDVAFNPSILSPRGHTINFINDTLATISMKDIPVVTIGNGKIITLTCDIGLGNAEQCELSLINVKENTGIVPLTIKNGTFKLLGVCYEGGARLVSTSKNTSLMSINPNPSDGMINVSIKMLEKGKHTIRILDSRGLLIDESVHDLQQGPINLRYDSLEFITGMYFIQLQTPTQSTIERFIIQK